MPQIWAVVAAGVLLAGFGANEASHGGVAEAMGFGHHHALDHGGYHCSDHDDAEHYEHHVEHMHGNATGVHHDECPGGYQDHHWNDDGHVDHDHGHGEDGHMMGGR